MVIQPLISIIMPVYNAESYLREAINSVLVQDHGNWELLVVDDGSSDNSLRIARDFDDPRVKVFSQTNAGPAKARNVGLSLMEGDFFCFLDADDVLTSDSLSQRLRCFDVNNICFCDGSVEVYNATMSVKVKKWTPQKPDNTLKSLVKLDGKCFFGPTWMVRRDRSVKYRFDEELSHGEDLFFYMSYAHLGEYTFTNKVVLKYRRSSNSSMSNLVGVANGYTLIKNKITSLGGKVSYIDRITFSLRSRKFVFLSFVNTGRSGLAFKYLLTGSI